LYHKKIVKAIGAAELPGKLRNSSAIRQREIAAGWQKEKQMLREVMVFYKTY